MPNSGSASLCLLFGGRFPWKHHAKVVVYLSTQVLIGNRGRDVVKLAEQISSIDPFFIFGQQVFWGQDDEVPEIGGQFVLLIHPRLCVVVEPDLRNGEPGALV